jgi:hypothetical protein
MPCHILTATTCQTHLFIGDYSSWKTIYSSEDRASFDDQELIEEKFNTKKLLTLVEQSFVHNRWAGRHETAEKLKV